MALSPSVPSRVVKVTLPEGVFQDLRKRAFDADVQVAVYVRRLVERHLGVESRRAAEPIFEVVDRITEKQVAAKQISKSLERPAVEPRFKK